MRWLSKTWTFYTGVEKMQLPGTHMPVPSTASQLRVALGAVPSTWVHVHAAWCQGCAAADAPAGHAVSGTAETGSRPCSLLCT